MGFKQVYEKNLGKEGTEIEVRFGKFNSSGRFTPGVSKEQFVRLLSYFEQNKSAFVASKIDETMSYYNKSDVRRSTASGFSKKKCVEKEDVPDFGLRLSVAKEEKIQKDLVSKFSEMSVSKETKRTRHSYTIEGSHRFDIDETLEGFSIEIESLGASFEVFYKNINLILQIIQDSSLVITRTEELKVVETLKGITKSNKFPGVQPVTLNASSFSSKEEYALTLKLDGLRFLCVCWNETLYFISQKNVVKKSNFKSKLENFILDGELFRGDYHIFDVVSSTAETLQERMNDALKIQKSLSKNDDGVKGEIYIKEHFYGNTFDIFCKLTKNLNYSVYDGVIFTKTKDVYQKSSPLKWKPVEKITIDLQIKGLELYAQGKDDLEKFATIDKSFPGYSDGDIAEFVIHEGKFYPDRHRYDKTKPNFIGVAQDNMASIALPFDVSLLKGKTEVLQGMRKYNNWIKRTYINKCKGNSVLDLACGKGGDFGKYIDSGFKTIVGFDINNESLTEAKSRAESFLKKEENNGISISVNHIDLTKKSAKIEGKVDLVVCNFAFHYFYKNLDLFIKSVLDNTNPGSKVLLTFFDKTKVKPQENDFWYIKPVGNDRIEVFIKGSVLDKPETEYLVDVDDVISKFGEKDIVLTERRNFSEFSKSWKQKLSKEEKLLSFMNDVLVFERK